MGAELFDRHKSGDFDCMHLHWLGNHTISIEEIGHLPLPLTWTLHDQWAFSGAEHYSSPLASDNISQTSEGFVSAYSPTERPTHKYVHDLNRRTWLRKQKAWRKQGRSPVQIVCPSRWMADCARRSALMGDWPISVIPYPIDLDVWSPFNQSQARALLGLPVNRHLVLFGAVSGLADPRKGGDLLLKALQILVSQGDDIALSQLELVVYGQSKPSKSTSVDFPIHYMGHLHDDLSLRILYAAADLFVISSRQDNLPNTGLEAQACGTPVVAFRTCGLVDIVDNNITGALAEPFDPASLAAAIRWVLEDPNRRRELALAARQRAENLWNPATIAGRYAEVYRAAVDS